MDAGLSGSSCLLLRGSERPLPAPLPRRSREFTPEELKDSIYWERRRRNNEAARKSRQKRRCRELVLERRLAELLEENCRLRSHLLALRLPEPQVAAHCRSGTPPLSIIRPAGLHTRGEQQPAPRGERGRTGSVRRSPGGPASSSEPAWVRSLPHKLRLKISSGGSAASAASLRGREPGSGAAEPRSQVNRSPSPGKKLLLPVFTVKIPSSIRTGLRSPPN